MCHGFFDFLAFSVKTFLLIGFAFFAVCTILTQYGEWAVRQKLRIKKQEKDRFFEQQKPRIVEAIELLQTAQNAILALASREARRYGMWSVSSTSRIMDEQLRLVIKGCRIKFGDYVTDQAPHNVGLGKYIRGGLFWDLF